MMNVECRKLWLKGRKKYLGGSDIAAIIGLSPFQSALDIYLSKTSPDIAETSSEAAHWGNILENVIAEEYSRKTGNKVEVPVGTIYHPEYKFIAANIDRWADGGKHILECKTASFTKAKEWGEEYTDQIPESYLCQVAYYAEITGVEQVDIAVLIGGQDFRIYRYNANKEFQEKLIKIAVNFWNNHIIKEKPPEASDLRDIANLYPVGNGLQVQANEEIAEKINSLKELKLQEKALTSDIKTLQFEIQEYMKEYDILIDNTGSIVATWKSSRPRTTIDAKKLKEEHEDIYLQYVRECKQSRTFLIK